MGHGHSSARSLGDMSQFRPKIHYILVFGGLYSICFRGFLIISWHYVSLYVTARLIRVHDVRYVSVWRVWRCFGTYVRQS